MNKADKDKVIDALSMNRVMAADAEGNYTREVTPKAITEALSIMRGLAEDAEPVGWMWQHDETGRTGFVDCWQVENNWQKNNPRLRLIGPIYTSPQAAQTDERNGCQSNCRTCQHFRRDTGGHCYMFKEEPQGVCAKWIASNTLAFGFPSNWAGRKG